MPGLFSAVSAFFGELSGDRQADNRSVEEYRTFAKSRDDDLNVALVIAALLSAVTTAFIIFVQPEFQENSNDETAALLRILIFDTTNCTLGDGVPQELQWNGVPHLVFVAQLFLYLSLLCELSCVLFSLLAKQMIRVFESALTRRGHQLANGGIVRSRFSRLSRILKILSFTLLILVQAALFFLTCGITIYIWKISTPIAGIILASILGGIPFFIIFAVSALSSLSQSVHVI